ncbi:hypothetical protein [Loktanella sp. Alg231-35]|uniref:hypothetical protein n=1 Tax=Loktanella sp. Alg231-35 TaxID=1922220 RepID=UPI000D555F4F|nr:hypothetical protein [Loktanella sp. Alg231-35]
MKKEPDDWYDTDLGEAEGMALRHSKRLDVHTWSEHPEVNGFVDEIYAQLKVSGNENIRKKHLKVVLLDLYLNWSSDPTLRTSFPRSPNEYGASSIYNELNISRLTIDVVDWLSEAQLVELKNGFFNKQTGKGFLSRMWPTDRLIKHFEQARFSAYDLGYHQDRLVIELRNEEKEAIEFEASGETDAMSAALNAYNTLLNRTFILLHSAEGNIATNQGPIVLAKQQGKFTRRVFSRSSFQLGGRFYGGWWQRCPSELRANILIDDKITAEVDFGSLHPNLLYARLGLDMWEALSVEPYQIEPVSFESNPSQLRLLAKQLLLTMLNAPDMNSIPAAFRHNQGPGTEWKKLTDEEVFEVTDQLIELHEPIAASFGSDVGIELQFLDSQIAAEIVDYFTLLSVPVLVIHDSFIVPQGWEVELELVMETSFKKITGTDFASKLKYSKMTYDDVMNELVDRYNVRHGVNSDEEDEADMEIYRVAHPVRTDWYANELQSFRAWQITLEIEEEAEPT